ncbi:hypothetical protein GcM1_247173 [Golovinomyces cichoracearum]|uniref:Uncharacterized protein n=1 Tax=Golovinomyces cichoracearum TaxID=62708 RepID=A0A420IDV2_9PEZI|nr:hypothetical protein GcM1_247173 [Golovinomyces cichoracearum]
MLVGPYSTLDHLYIHGRLYILSAAIPYPRTESAPMVKSRFTSKFLISILFWINIQRDSLLADISAVCFEEQTVQNQLSQSIS